MMIEGYMKADEAAEALKISVRSIQRHIQRGHIHATKVHRDYLIPINEIERFKRERRTAGRPKKEEDTQE